MKLQDMSIDQLRVLAARQIGEQRRLEVLAAEMRELSLETLGVFYEKVNGLTPTAKEGERGT